MADAQSLARAIVDVGDKGVDDARAEITQLESSLDALGVAYQQGKLKISEYALESTRLRGNIDHLKAGVAGAESAIRTYGSSQAAAAAIAEQADSATRSFGRGVSPAALVDQDFLSAGGDLAQAMDRLQNTMPLLLTDLGGAGTIESAGEGRTKHESKARDTAREAFGESDVERRPARVDIPGAFATESTHDAEAVKRVDQKRDGVASRSTQPEIARPSDEAEQNAASLIRGAFERTSPPAGEKFRAVAGTKEREQQPAPDAQGRDNTQNDGRLHPRRQDRKEERLAEAMKGGSAGRAVLANASLSDTDLRERARDAMRASGMKPAEIEPALEGVVKRLREKVDQEVQRTSIRTGMTPEQARAAMSRDAAEKAKQEQDQGPTAQVMSTEQYLNHLLTASLSRKDRIPDQQLDEARRGNRTLEQIRKELREASKRRGNMPSTFSAARGPR